MHYSAYANTEKFYNKYCEKGIELVESYIDLDIPKGIKESKKIWEDSIGIFRKRNEKSSVN